MAEILKLVDISKKYNDRVILSNINLKIEKEDIYGILGLSGAGKSTLVRCINGLEKHDNGKIIYKGEEIKNFTSAYRRKVAMIFQSFNLLSQRTVLKNVEITGEIIKEEKRKEKALHLLDLVGLKDKAYNYPEQLSGGEKQRVAIARALMSDPEILLSDEATSALDPETTIQILSLLKDLNKKLGLTIILISHQMNVIENICNKVAIISDSKIVEDGPIHEVFLSPKTKAAKNLIYSGHINTKMDGKNFIKIIFDGEVDEPIITNIIKDCKILLSIVYADSKIIGERMCGQLILKLPNYDKDIKILREYLETQKIRYEEVSDFGSY